MTGGAGYIGVHTLLALVKRGDRVIVVDNLSNTDRYNIDLLIKDYPEQITLIIADISKNNVLKNIFSKYDITKIVHLAGCKSIKASINNEEYTKGSNIFINAQLIECMKVFDVKNILFASTSSIYSSSKESFNVTTCWEGDEIKEPLNPFAYNKLQLEKELEQFEEDGSVIIFRYFEVIGMSREYKFKDSSTRKSDGILPLIKDFILGKSESITTDVLPSNSNMLVTPIRDYIHINDVVDANLKALDKMDDYYGYDIYNVGTGEAYDAMKIARLFVDITRVNFDIMLRNNPSMDFSILISDSQKLKACMGWEPKYSIGNALYDEFKAWLR